MLAAQAQKASGDMDDSVKPIARPAPSRSLKEAVRQARLEEAGRLDLTADRRDGEIARLELLRGELEPIFAQLPSEDDRFTLALVPSRPARLWIDLFHYAAIDENSGTYLFIRNSENGRRTLASAAHVGEIADRITDHLAREIVRRERLEAALLEPIERQKLEVVEPKEGPGLGVVVTAYIIGLMTGAVALFGALWFSVP
jgi:hypothetical protein